MSGILAQFTILAIGDPWRTFRVQHRVGIGLRTWRYFSTVPTFFGIA